MNDQILLRDKPEIVIERSTIFIGPRPQGYYTVNGERIELTQEISIDEGK